MTLLPDAGPLITLAYADALDLLLKPGWQVSIVDMVLFEVTRNQTPTSERIKRWVSQHEIKVLPTQTLAHYRANPTARRNLGEQAIQEVINQFVLQATDEKMVLLFEDHAIARSSFFVPDGCQKISTRAFLIFLEQKAWIENANAVERRAIQAGRQFSQLRFP